MNTLTITIGILAPVITFLIGRYFRAVKAKELNNVSKARDYFEGLYESEREYAVEVKKLFDESMELLNNRNEKVLQLQDEVIELNSLKSFVNQLQKDIANYQMSEVDAPKFQIVANKDKHPAANDNYLYIEGKINGKREAGLLRLSQWNEAKKTLLKNPEDKPNNQ